MRAIRFAVAVALTVAALPSAALATKPHDRSGLFVGFGFGAGNAVWDWAFPAPDDPSEGSGVVNLRVGGAVRNNLVLGLETSTWVKDYELEFDGADVGDAKITFAATMFGATWFPGNAGFFLRGGLGFATAKCEVDLDLAGVEFLDLESTDKGAAALGAAGYEWRLTDTFALGPQVEFVFLGIDGEVVDSVAIVNGSVQFNWYW